MPSNAEPIVQQIYDDMHALVRYVRVCQELWLSRNTILVANPEQEPVSRKRARFLR
jgi:hypothetical protein